MFTTFKEMALIRSHISNQTIFLIFNRLRHQYKNKYGNIGIKKRLGIISEDSDLSKVNINEDILEDMEADFMNSSEIYNDHKRKIWQINMKKDLAVVERKYMDKENLPNMITWAEKEQIRHLHVETPDIWTVEKLSRSFPATPVIIQKILKSSWRPRSKERIQKHDKMVLYNWKLLREGKLRLPPDLKSHLHSFSTRHNKIKLPGIPEEKAMKVRQAKCTEFLKIVTSYSKGATTKDESTQSEEVPLHVKLKKQFVVDNVRLSRRHITLDKLREKLKNVSTVQRENIMLGESVMVSKGINQSPVEGEVDASDEKKT